MPIEKRRYTSPTMKTRLLSEDVLTASGDIKLSFDVTWLGGNESEPTETGGWTP